MSNNVLCIGSHVDDEAFGCLGALIYHKKMGDTLQFLWFTQARDTVKAIPMVTEYFNNAPYTYADLVDQQLDIYSFTNLIKIIEETLDLYKPNVIYCPFIGDLNRDHRVVAEATMVACRPYLPNAPKEVWMYSIPGSTNLGLRQFQADRIDTVDKGLKEQLIREWYPGELIHGRELVSDIESFELWPK